MSWLPSWLEAKNATTREAGLWRTLKQRTSGSDIIDLASNDYLGLSHHPDVIAAACRATQEWGSSSTGSRLVTGTTALHAEFDRELADFVRLPAALTFSSGYMANLGALTMATNDVLLISDQHIHASLIDSARLTRTNVAIASHSDIDDIASLIHSSGRKKCLVMVESIYSVLGDAAPLEKLVDLCQDTGSVLLVDEAHAIGVIGTGHGMIANLDSVDPDSVIVTGTLSKALGSQGGFVAGSEALIDWLINHARSFIFDTGVSPASVAAARESMKIIVSQPERIDRLHEIASSIAERLGIERAAGAVQSAAVSSPEIAVNVASRSLQRGVQIGAFRPPSVPDGVSRLRLSARADLTDEQIAWALDTVTDVLGGLS